MTLEEYFSTGPPHERPVCEAVLDFMKGVEPVHVEPLSVGIYFKKAQTFAQLRPMRRWVALSLGLPRRVDHPTMTRKVMPYGGRFYHVFNLRRPEDFDEAIQGWLIEAYETSPD
jgi:hypothetical protein